MGISGCGGHGCESKPCMSELLIARDEAARIGIRHIEISTHEFSRIEYRRNAGDPCFYCKDTLYSLAAEKLDELQVGLIVNGANADDLGIIDQV